MADDLSEYGLEAPSAAAAAGGQVARLRQERASAALAAVQAQEAAVQQVAARRQAAVALESELGELRDGHHDITSIAIVAGLLSWAQSAYLERLVMLVTPEPGSWADRLTPAWAPRAIGAVVRGGVAWGLDFFGRKLPAAIGEGFRLGALGGGTMAVGELVGNDGLRRGEGFVGLQGGYKVGYEAWQGDASRKAAQMDRILRRQPAADS